MILEKQTENLELTEGEVGKSYNTEIDFESAFFLKQMLSKFYSDAIGSLIRETASNALDSQREAGVNEPIIVGLNRTNNGNYEFSVEDFGTGINTDTIDKILRKYGKSTRRADENKLGLYGLGWKSPLAYTSAFYFIGRKDGIETKAMMYEGEDDIKIDVLHELPTDKRNGVKVIVPVKYNDYRNFISKMKEQLAYFENVYFDCADIPNDFTIVRSEHFQWSSLVNTDKLHLCLDDVYYPIDFDKIGIQHNIRFPVALRFGLNDGIFLVPQRESIKYTKEAKEAILNKLKEVSTYFVNKYNDGIKETGNIHEIIKFHQYSTRTIPHFDGKTTLNIDEVSPYSTVSTANPTLKGIKLLSTKRIYQVLDYLLREYKNVYYYKHHSGRFENIENSSWNTELRYNYHLSNPIYVFSGTLTPTKKTFLKETVLNKNAYFVRKDKSFKLGTLKQTGSGYDNYIMLLELANYPKSEWRDRIKECQYVISLLTKDFVDLGEITINTKWLEDRKQANKKIHVKTVNGPKKRKLEGEITGKISEHLERYVSGKNCKFVSHTWDMKTAHRNKYVLIYGSKEQEDKLQELYKVFHKEEVRLAIFSDRELNNVKKINLHNWISLDTFMEGNHRIFKRKVTAYLISRLENQYSSTFNRSENLYKVSDSLANAIKAIHSYSDRHHKGANEDIYTSMLEIANEKGSFDTSIYDVYLKVKAKFEKLYFLNTLLSNFSKWAISDEEILCLRDLFKYHKEKLNWQYYLKEETKQEENE